MTGKSSLVSTNRCHSRSPVIHVFGYYALLSLAFENLYVDLSFELRIKEAGSQLCVLHLSNTFSNIGFRLSLRGYVSVLHFLLIDVHSAACISLQAANVVLSRPQLWVSKIIVTSETL